MLLLWVSPSISFIAVLYLWFVPLLLNISSKPQRSLLQSISSMNLFISGFSLLKVAFQSSQTSPSQQVAAAADSDLLQQFFVRQVLDYFQQGERQVLGPLGQDLVRLGRSWVLQSNWCEWGRRGVVGSIILEWGRSCTCEWGGGDCKDGLTVVRGDWRIKSGSQMTQSVKQVNRKYKSSDGSRDWGGGDSALIL